MAEKEVKLFSNGFMATAFAVSNLLLVLLLMWTVSSEYNPEWKRYQREYYQLFAEKTDDPVLRQKILSTPLEIKQIWNPKLDVTDRCTSCHLGVENPKMTDVPHPFKVHPDFTQHKFYEIGCTVCHEGQGTATTIHDAHVMHDLNRRFGPFDEQHIGWSRPLLPLEYVQASCQKCHNVIEAPVPGADHLNAGWQIVQEKGCKTCHYIVDSGAKQAPELSTAGTKFFNESGHSRAFKNIRFGYLKESLRCPQANLDAEAARECKARLVQAPPVPALNAAEGGALTGDALTKKYQCVSCHSFDSPVKLVGPSLYDIGARKDGAYIRESLLEPDKTMAEGFAESKGIMKAMLSGVGFFNDIQQNPALVDTLVTYLSEKKGAPATAAAPAAQDQSAHAAAAPAAQASAVVVMPNFGLNDDELRNVVTFLLGLREHSVSWPQKSFAQTAEGEAARPAAQEAMLNGSGAELVKTAGCIACHKFDGPDRLVGPSLWDIGARQDKTSIRESILDPDKVLTAGDPPYPPGVMKATLAQTGFYGKISVEALEELVNYLASLKGKS